MNPCEQEGKIEQLVRKAEQATLDTAGLVKGQKDLAAQHVTLVQKLDGFFDRLEAILLADMERRTQMDQALRDIDQLFRQHREAHIAIDAIHTRNAICDGANVIQRTEKMWTWMQQEQGWRRFLPVAISLIVGLLAIYVTITDIQDRSEMENFKADLYQEYHEEFDRRLRDEIYQNEMEDRREQDRIKTYGVPKNPSP